MIKLIPISAYQGTRATPYADRFTDAILFYIPRNGQNDVVMVDNVVRMEDVHLFGVCGSGTSFTMVNEFASRGWQMEIINNTWWAIPPIEVKNEVS